MMLLVKNFRRCWNLKREEEDDGIVSEDIQLFSTRLEKEGLVSHICLNLKGSCTLPTMGSVSTNMGQ